MDTIKNSIELEEINSIELIETIQPAAATADIHLSNHSHSKNPPPTSTSSSSSSSTSSSGGSQYSTSGSTSHNSTATTIAANIDPSTAGSSAEITGPTSGPSGSARTAFAERVRSATACIQAGDYGNAIRLYTEALKLDPSNHVLYGNRSAVFCRMGKHKKALQDAIKARELCPQWSKAYYRQGIALQCQHDYADALAAFASGLAQDRSSSQLFAAIVEAAMKSPMRATLEPIYRQLQVMNLLSPFVITSIVGQELLSSGHYAAAAVVLESALQIGTGSMKLRGSVLSALSSAYWAMNKLDVAISYMRQDLQVAVSLSDTLGECRAHGNLGAAYFGKCNYKQALTEHRYQLMLAMRHQQAEQAALALTALGHVYSAIGDLPNAISSHQQCLSLVRKIGDPLAEAREIGNVGAVHLASGDSTRAIECHLEHVKLAKLLGNRQEEARAYSNLGSAYHFRRNYEQAIQFHEQVLRISQEIGDRVVEAKAYAGLGHAARCMNDHIQAKRWYERQLDIALNTKDRGGEARACSNLGTVYQLLGDFDGALKLHWSHLNICKQQNDTAGIGRAYGNIGNAYSALKQYEEALKYHKLELQIAKEVHDRGAEASTHGNLAIAYQALGLADQALTHLNLHLSVASEMRDATSEANAYAALGNYYAARSDFDVAVRYYERYVDRSRTLGDTESEAKANHLLGVAHHRAGRHRDAARCFEIDLELSKAMQDRAAIGRAYCHLGFAKAALGDLDAALECQRHFLCTASGDTAAKLRAIGNVADVLTRSGRCAEAKRMLEKQLQLARSVGDVTAEANIFAALGGCECAAGNFDDAARYYKQELIFRQGAADIMAEIAALDHLGDCYYKQDNYTLALKCFLDQVEKCEQHTASLRSSATIADCGGGGGGGGGEYDSDGYYGRRQAAIDSFRRFLEASHRTAKAYHNVANTRFRMSHFAEAHTLYEREVALLDEIIPLAEKRIARADNDDGGGGGGDDGDGRKKKMNIVDGDVNAADASGSNVDDDDNDDDDDDMKVAEKRASGNRDYLARIVRQLAERRTACSRSIGDCYFARAEYDDAIRHYHAFLPASKSVAEQEQVYCLLGKCYQLSNNLAQALVAYEKRLVLAHELGCTRTKAIAYGELGHIHRLMSNFEQAISCFKHEQELSKDATLRNDPSASSSSHDKNINLNETNANRSIRNMQKTIGEVFATDKTPILRHIGAMIEAEALHGLGCVAQEMHDHERALKYHSSALTIGQEIKSLELESRAYGAIGASYNALGKYESAIQYQQKYLSVTQTTGDLDAQISALSELGKIHSTTAQYRFACDYLQQALQLIGKHRRSIARCDEEEARICYELGMALWAVNDLRASELQLRRSVDLIESLPHHHGSGANGGAASHMCSRIVNHTTGIVRDFYSPLSAPNPSQSPQSPSSESSTGSSASSSSQANNYAQFQLATLMHQPSSKPSPAHQHLHYQGASYEALTKILIALGRPTEALLIAERSRARSFHAKSPKSSGPFKPLAISSAEQIVQMSRAQNAAILYYAMTIDGSYNSWLITPTGVRFSPLVKSSREKILQLLSTLQNSLLAADERPRHDYARQNHFSQNRPHHHPHHHDDDDDDADDFGGFGGDAGGGGDDELASTRSSPSPPPSALHHLQRNHFLNSSNYSLSSLFSLASSVASSSTAASHRFARSGHRNGTMRSSNHSIKSAKSYSNISLASSLPETASRIGCGSMMSTSAVATTSYSPSSAKSMKRSISNGNVGGGIQSTRNRRSAWQGSASLITLYDMLIGPFQDQLDEESSLAQLLLVLDGDLFLVPWNMLRSEEDEFLSERYSLLVMPSLHVLRGDQNTKTLRRNATSARARNDHDNNGGRSRSLSASSSSSSESSSASTTTTTTTMHQRNTISSLVVANPTMPNRFAQNGKNHLHHQSHSRRQSYFDNAASSREAAFVSELLSTRPLIGTEANKEAVLAQLTTAQCIHFSSYIVDNTDGDPLRMATGLGIAISPPDMLIGDAAHPLHDHEYLLTPHDLISIGLSAKLVVISCCALSSRSSSCGASAAAALNATTTFHSSQALKCITSALLEAGAACVLLTLWPVPLSALQILFRVFYCSLLQGTRVSAALNEAISTIQNTSHFSHPRNWAGFLLIGTDVRLSSQCAAMSSALTRLLRTPEKSRDAMRVTLHLVEKSLQRIQRGRKNAMYTTQQSIENKVGAAIRGWRELLISVGFRFEPSTTTTTTNNAVAATLPACVFFPQSDPSGRLIRCSAALQAILALTPATIYAISKLIKTRRFVAEIIEQLAKVVRQHQDQLQQHSQQSQQQLLQIETVVHLRLWSAPGCHELYASLGFDLMEVNGSNSVKLRAGKNANMMIIAFALQTLQALYDKDDVDDAPPPLPPPPPPAPEVVSGKNLNNNILDHQTAVDDVERQPPQQYGKFNHFTNPTISIAKSAKTEQRTESNVIDDFLLLASHRRGEPDGQQNAHKAASLAGSNCSTSPTALTLGGGADDMLPCSRGFTIGRSLLDSEMIERKLNQMSIEPIETPPMIPSSSSSSSAMIKCDFDDDFVVDESRQQQPPPPPPINYYRPRATNIITTTTTANNAKQTSFAEAQDYFASKFQASYRAQSIPRQSNISPPESSSLIMPIPAPRFCNTPAYTIAIDRQSISSTSSIATANTVVMLNNSNTNNNQSQNQNQHNRPISGLQSTSIAASSSSSSHSSASSSASTASSARIAAAAAFVSGQHHNVSRGRGQFIAFDSNVNETQKKSTSQLETSASTAAAAAAYLLKNPSSSVAAFLLPSASASAATLGDRTSSQTIVNSA